MVPTSFAFLDMDTPELLIILAIVLLLFGGKKLPQLTKSLGESIRELRKGLSGDIHEETKSKVSQANEEKQTDGVG